MIRAQEIILQQVILFLVKNIIKLFYKKYKNNHKNEIHYKDFYFYIH